MFNRLRRAFRGIDTTTVDAAIADAEAAHKAVGVRARALRRGVSCGDPVAAVKAMGGPVLAALAPMAPFDIFAVDPRVPREMNALLRKI